MTAQMISCATVRSWLPPFFLAKESAGLSPNTLTMYRNALGYYLAWVDSHDGLGPLDPTAVEMYLKELRTKSARATVYSRYRVLSAFIGWLVKRRYILPNESPLLLVDKPKQTYKRMKFVTKEQFDKLYASIRGDDGAAPAGGDWAAWRDRLLITILFYSGLRASELVNLRVADIERAEQVIFVRSGKGQKDRHVPYAPQVEDLLDRYLKARPDCAARDALFISSDGWVGARSKIGREGLKMIMQRLCKRAGMRRLGIHVFRHGFAMTMLNNGMDVSALAAAMGHSNVTVTLNTYARWVTSGLRMEYNAAYQRIVGPEAVAP